MVPGDTVADLVAAFGGKAEEGGWFFPISDGTYRLDHSPDGPWVVGFIERNQYRRRVELANERMAVRYLLAMLRPSDANNPPLAPRNDFSREDR